MYYCTGWKLIIIITIINPWALCRDSEPQPGEQQAPTQVSPEEARLHQQRTNLRTSRWGGGLHSCNITCQVRYLNLPGPVLWIRIRIRIRICMHPHHFANLDPHPDPHPQQIKIRIRTQNRIEKKLGSALGSASN
jgi:hypothetical protein